MRTSLLAASALMLAACASTMNTPLGDIPKLTKLDQVMDNQATAIDPQFKKIGHDKFDDAEIAAVAAAAERVQATSAKIKDFSKGPEFDAIAAKLNEKAKALGAAATAKDGKAINATLTEMRGLCRQCHGKFR